MSPENDITPYIKTVIESVRSALASATLFSIGTEAEVPTDRLKQLGADCDDALQHIRSKLKASTVEVQQLTDAVGGLIFRKHSFFAACSAHCVPTARLLSSPGNEPLQRVCRIVRQLLRTFCINVQTNLRWRRKWKPFERRPLPRTFGSNRSWTRCTACC